MRDWKLPRKGGCRCGETRVELTAPPMIAAVCHCTGCQRMTASAFSMTLTVPSAGFAVTQGSPVIGGMHGAPRHFFCPRCMSWMFTRPEGMDEIVNVRAPVLDDHRDFTPFIETYTQEKLPWVTTPAVHSYPTFPPMADFMKLIEEFGAQSG